nr:fasciclin-like arabinogalactan protein 1 [Arachis hypogaea]
MLPIPVTESKSLTHHINSPSRCDLITYFFARLLRSRWISIPFSLLLDLDLAFARFSISLSLDSRSRSRSISILDGASKFNFTVQNDGDQVTLKTKIVTAKITGTLIDEDPLAIYTIDKVLLPRELFKVLAPFPLPAPASEPATANAPASPKKEGKKKK